jgi:Mrp family chromosome partitioning ATPase/capsular polysaccharide biosynthesis protein
MADLSLTDYFHIVRRRMWIIGMTAAITTLVAVLYSTRQPAVYATSADVLLRSQTLPSSISGLSDPNAPTYYVDPDRTMTTQIGLARLPLMAERVLAASPQRSMSTGQFLGSSSVSAVPNTDFLRFGVSTSDPAVAKELANEYARQYTLYRKQLDTQSVENSLRTLASRIRQLRAAGDRASLENATQLQEKADQLRTLVALQQANALVVRKAQGAAQVEPRPRRNGVLGLALGLVLGLGLALLREATDTRLRSTEGVSGVLNDLPLLARIPDPGRQLRRANRLAMLAEPNGVSAESFRMLRTNLEFASLGKQAQVIIVTSALDGEGKSTTSANLAVALARAGKDVVLADLDLRQPGLYRFFDVGPASPGLTDVVLGHVTLTEALLPVPLVNAARETQTEPVETTNGSRPNIAEGVLELLVAGTRPPNPGEFVGSDGVRRVVGELRERADLIIVDTPPVLHVGDPMIMAGFVDAILIVVNREGARRPVLAELMRVVSRSPAQPLGFVVCGGGGTPGAYHYSGYGYTHRTERRAEAELFR